MVMIFLDRDVHIVPHPLLNIIVLGLFVADVLLPPPFVKCLVGLVDLLIGVVMVRDFAILMLTPIFFERCSAARSISPGV